MSKAAAKLKTDQDGFVQFESSNIHSGKFDDTRNVIIMRFHNGSQYEYPGCDQKLWKDGLAAKSIGSWVHQQLSKKPDTKIDDWK